MQVVKQALASAPPSYPWQKPSATTDVTSQELPRSGSALLNTISDSTVCDMGALHQPHPSPGSHSSISRKDEEVVLALSDQIRGGGGLIAELKPGARLLAAANLPDLLRHQALMTDNQLVHQV